MIVQKLLLLALGLCSEFGMILQLSITTIANDLIHFHQQKIELNNTNCYLFLLVKLMQHYWLLVSFFSSTSFLILL
jgi:hypothetical protein